MASPPYAQSPTALSPPYSAHPPLPPQLSVNTMPSKKRTVDGSGPSPALKRRKASTMSVASTGTASAHPLRQTSFPPDDDETAQRLGLARDARSPSFDEMSLVSGSQVSGAGAGASVGAGAGARKKRGRRGKADRMREQTPSLVGGRAATAISDGGAGRSNVAGAGGDGAGGSGSGIGGAGAGAGEDDGPDDEEVAIAGTQQTEQEKQEEHRMRTMLINALSPEQFARYENWRAASLAKANVRRLINSTISQSVTDNIVIGMRAVSKLFLGQIIESARRIQGEWIEKLEEKQTDLPTPAAPSAAASPAAIIGDSDKEPLTRDVRRGPLRPEHLREALRRYKLGLEGGGVGMQEIWYQQQMNGAERFPARTGGRRIFR